MAQDYHDTLRLYYEEEIEGAAYFEALAMAFEDPDHSAKLMLLARVERFAAAAVKPLIDRHGLVPRADAALIASGRAQAQDTAPDWPALIAAMTDSYPGYLDAFQRLEAMGPPEDRRRLAILTEHEVAALAFLELEPADPGRSAAPLLAYLGVPPVTPVAAAL